MSNCIVCKSYLYLWWYPLWPGDLDSTQLAIVASLDTEFDWLARSQASKTFCFYASLWRRQ